LPEALRFGKVEVSCEGWSKPGDPYVLKGPFIWLCSDNFLNVLENRIMLVEIPACSSSWIVAEN